MNNAAETIANTKANSFQRRWWQAFADVMKAVNGPALDWAALLRGGTMQFNRVGRTNDAGEVVNGLLPLTAAGVFALGAVNWQIAAPSDRLRIILNMKCRLLVGDSGSVDGSVPVPHGAHQQLIQYGLLDVNRQRGNRVVSVLDSYMEVAPNFRNAFGSVAADGSLGEQAYYALPRIPYEQEVMPGGFMESLVRPLDALNKQERSQFTVRAPGLDGIAATGLAEGQELYLQVEAAVWDGVLSGQGS